MLAGVAGRAIEVLAYHDAKAGRYRFAAFDNDRLAAALFIAPGPVTISREWAGRQLSQTCSPIDRLRFLAGRSGHGEKDRGPIVCACFGVGRNQIADAATQGADTVEAIGGRLNAGTNCGSCRAEIRKVIDASRLAKAG